MVNSLTEQIRKTSLDLITRRLDGEIFQPINPFTIEDLSFDYAQINPKYHVSENSDDEVILYKGAKRGYEQEGLLSMALNGGLANHVVEVKAIIEQGNDELIRELFDQHTSYYSYTALLSATFNPEQAQVFAPTHPLARKRQDETIYQIRIKANRCVVDCYDTGNCGPNKEVLILGTIFPEEISAVKLINDDKHSELIKTWNGVLLIQRHPDKNSTNRDVKNPNNWIHL
ncbi:MAG: hypothetical protein ABIB79_02270 [archaeon]